MLSFLAFLQHCIRVGFIRFLFSGQSGSRSKMWNLVVIFSYWHANSSFSLSLCNCHVFLIHSAFFYTQCSLVEGHLEVSYLHSFSFLDLHESGTRVFSVCSTLVSKVSYYLGSYSLLYLHKSGTRASLVYSKLVSKVSYYLDFSLQLYLHESGTRLVQGVALFQTSLHFSTFMSQAQKHLSSHCIILGFTFLFDFHEFGTRQQIKWGHIISGFTLLFYFHVQQLVVWLSLPLHSGQSDTRLEPRVHEIQLLLLTHLPLACCALPSSASTRDNLCRFMYIFN